MLNIGSLISKIKEKLWQVTLLIFRLTMEINRLLQ